MKSEYLTIYNNLINFTRNKDLYKSLDREDNFSDRLTLFLLHFAFFLKNFKNEENTTDVWGPRSPLQAVLQHRNYAWLLRVAPMFGFFRKHERKPWLWTHKVRPGPVYAVYDDMPDWAYNISDNSTCTPQNSNCIGNTCSRHGELGTCQTLE